MKVTVIIILFSLAMGIIVPPVLALTFAQEGLPCIGTADVCHAAESALASGGEMPCVHERFPCQRPAAAITTFDQQDPLLLFTAVFFPIEQPPRS
ncbi:MAG: hypothetical protein ACYC7L_15970 [Nitrospirota bacterium]